MVDILDNSEREKEIAYRELDEKYKVLENLYAQLSSKENMLIHLEKLSSIGQFVTEIIHELKNPLMVISGVTEIVLLKPELQPQIAQKLQRIPAQVERMINYLNRFRAMAYKEKKDFKVFRLNTSLEDFLETIEIIKPKNVSIVKRLCEDALNINGDPDQITQIFLNLAKNAFDAMETNGDTFTVSTEVIDGKKAEQLQNQGFAGCQSRKDWKDIVETNQTFALLNFCDNGSGIPDDLIQNIFDAFFTTKTRGKGTGLGLSIAADITLRHNANLMVRSKQNEGTTFKFVIPLVDECEQSNEGVKV